MGLAWALWQNVPLRLKSRPIWNSCWMPSTNTAFENTSWTICPRMLCSNPSLGGSHWLGCSRHFINLDTTQTLQILLTPGSPVLYLVETTDRSHLSSRLVATKTVPLEVTILGHRETLKFSAIYSLHFPLILGIGWPSKCSHSMAWTIGQLFFRILPRSLHDPIKLRAISRWLQAEVAGPTDSSADPKPQLLPKYNDFNDVQIQIFSPGIGIMTTQLNHSQEWKFYLVVFMPCLNLNWLPWTPTCSALFTSPPCPLECWSFLFKKKDDSFWLCMEYWTQNEVTIRNLYPCI